MFLDSNGVTEIFAGDFGSIVAGSDVAKKLFLQNDKARLTGAIIGSILQYGDLAGSDLITWGICPDTVSCPFNVQAEAIAGGSLVAATRYYYRVTAFNDQGETGGSLEVSALTTEESKAISLTWERPAGASGYIVYRSTNQVYTNARRTVIEDPATLAWTDTGQASDASSAYGWPGINEDFDLPSENTTAGEGSAYGSPPALSAANLGIGSIQRGQQVAFWVQASTAVSTAEADYYFILDFAEDM